MEFGKKGKVGRVRVVGVGEGVGVGVGVGEKGTHMNGHLDARLRARALVDDVEPVGLVEVLQRGGGALLSALECECRCCCVYEKEKREPVD